MRPLAVPPLPSAILSFDFDGTLHDPASEPPIAREVFEWVRGLREERGVVWGINTGRSLPHMIEGFLESRFPFLPDWVVARECEIHFANPFGRWLPHESWNRRCDKEVRRLFKRLRKLLAHLRREIEEHTGARWLEMHGEPAGVIARTEEEMAWIVAHITPLVEHEPHLAWQRNSIYLRFGHRDYQKGSSLAEVARIYRLSVGQCFAMGDSFNDMEMLDPAHAGMAACPANAIHEIKVKVLAGGGIVTNATHGAAVVEALRHYFGGSGG